jgi:type IV pilus assembly protein PilA
MIRNNKGFSLVELMVVVAIIGILSAIAIPQINKYMARARQTEAKLNLSALYTSNKAFYAEYGIYDSRFDVIGFRPEGKLRYNTGWASNAGQCTLADYGYTGDVGSADTNAVAQCGTGAQITGTSTCTVLADGNHAIVGSSLVCSPTQREFTAGAIARISSGPDLDQWTIDQVKDLRNRQDGTQ